MHAARDQILATLRHDAFQALLRKFGDPDTIMLKTKVIAAVTSGPAPFEAQDDRFSRASGLGGTGEIGLAVALVETLELDASGGLRRFGFAMNSQPVARLGPLSVREPLVGAYFAVWGFGRSLPAAWTVFLASLGRVLS